MAIHRWLLRLCPPDVRREYGAEIEEMFVRRMSEARASGRWRLVQAWRREVASLVVFGIVTNDPIELREEVTSSHGYWVWDSQQESATASRAALMTR